MIKAGLFPRLHARFKRLNEFDVVCDRLARDVANTSAASKRQAAALPREGIAPPEGDDSEDSGERDARPDPPVDPVVAEEHDSAARSASNRKGKGKVGCSRVEEEVPLFDANMPEVPEDPSSDLNPRSHKGKRPAESSHTARPAKRASRTVEFVVSSDEEGNGEAGLVRNDPAMDARSASPTARDGAAESSHFENVEPSRQSSPIPDSVPAPVTQPNPSTHPTVDTQCYASTTPTSEPNMPAATPEATRTDLPSTSAGASGSRPISLSDFSATDILAHIVKNDVYVGASWDHVKRKPCNGKLEFFFNCCSLMMSEMTENYLRGNTASLENRRIREQVSGAVAEKLSAEESFSQQLAQLSESADRSLAAQLAAEEKLSVAEEEIKALKEQLLASQDSHAAQLEVSRLTDEAREKAEREVEDLKNQQVSREAIEAAMRTEQEAQSVDRFKRSPAYDALLLREFERGMRQAKNFFSMKDHSNEKALARFDKSLKRHMDGAVDVIKDQIKRWKAHCSYMRTEPQLMHLEIPTKSAFNTYHSGRKGSLSASGSEPDLGPVAGRDYEPFMPMGDEEVKWPSEDEMADDDDEGADANILPST